MDNMYIESKITKTIDVNGTTCESCLAYKRSSESLCHDMIDCNVCQKVLAQRTSLLKLAVDLVRLAVEHNRENEIENIVKMIVCENH